MRRVDRSKVTPPEILVSKTDKGAKERLKALEFYKRLKEVTEGTPDPDVKDLNPAKGRRKKKSKDVTFKFKAYGDPAVRQVLEQLFAHKCAYCESRYAATQPMDVEHWRPKAMIETEEGEKITPGYYWLAAEWENLLPSCIDCNRRREHLIESTGERRVVGKGNRFPLGAGCRHATDPGSESEEEPLLLNPYTDYPEQHLEFLSEGIVRPRVDDAGKHSAKGAISIEVYALNRTGLVQDRKEVLLLIQQRMYTVLRLTQMLEGRIRKEHRDVIEDLLLHEMESLVKFGDDDHPYSAMASRMIDEFIATITPPTEGDNTPEDNE